MSGLEAEVGCDSSGDHVPLPLWHKTCILAGSMAVRSV